MPEDAIVTHVITCQGRDHIVNVQSGRQKLELTLRRSRERLRLITPHWPPYPNAVGIIMGDINICEPEEGRFNVWNQTFTHGDTRKAALFHSLFPHVLEIAQPDCTRRDSSVNVPYARCQGLIVSLLTCLLLRHVTFIAAPMFSRIW